MLHCGASSREPPRHFRSYADSSRIRLRSTRLRLPPRGVSAMAHAPRAGGTTWRREREGAPYLPRARTTASGSRSMTVSRTRAARSGTRRPCSHSCTVRTSSPKLSANFWRLSLSRLRSATMCSAAGSSTIRNGSGCYAAHMGEHFVEGRFHLAAHISSPRSSSVSFLLLYRGNQPQQQTRPGQCAAVPHLSRIGSGAVIMKPIPIHYAFARTLTQAEDTWEYSRFGTPTTA